MIETYSLEEINKIAKQILSTPNLKKVITFHATMGAGKTTLIKELVKELFLHNSLYLLVSFVIVGISRILNIYVFN